VISTGHNFKVIEEEIEGKFYAKKLIIGQDVQQFTSLTTEIIFSQMISSFDENPEKETLFVKY
jgi:hypothetical protein